MKYTKLLVALLLFLDVGDSVAQSTGINGPPGAGSGGTPGGANTQVQYNNNGAFDGITNGISGQVLTSNGVSAIPTFQTIGGTGTVTSVALSIPGGIYTITGSPITTNGTLTATPAGTSGGIPYFSSATSEASSALLTANALVLGGGAASAPVTLGSLGTTTTILHGNAAGAPSFGAVSLTADVSGILPSANGGTANGFFTVAGPATSTKTFTFPNASANVLTDNTIVTVTQGGTGIGSGTSGGILYFSGTGTLASSAALTANALVLGGGAGGTPTVVASLGTSGQVLTSNGAGAAPTFQDAAAGGGSASDIQVFTSTGANTWTKPSGSPKYTTVILIGAGGGGGGGADLASGTGMSGGGGGGAGFLANTTYDTSTLGATETCTVGTGGTAGTAGSTSSGGAGGVGGSSTFGSWLTAFGGGGGQGGANGTNSAGGGSAGSFQAGGSGSGGTGGTGGSVGGVGGANNGTGSSNASAGGAGAGDNLNAGSSGGSSIYAPSGGGSGAGLATTPVALAGGGGGRTLANTTQAAGGAASSNGTAGSVPTGNYTTGGQGGGGGGSSTAATAGTGGAGVRGGGGGGGGAALTVTATAAAGGAGGNGYCAVITTY